MIRMTPLARFYLYIITVAFAFIVALWRMKRLNKAFKILTLLIGLTFTAELTAHLLAMKYANNMIVFHIYTPVLLLLVCAYFHHSNPVFRRLNVLKIVSVAGIAAAIANSYYLQPINTFNTNYILFTGFCVIAMSLVSFYRYYTDNETINIISRPDFQVSLLFLFYWSSTFISFAFHELLEESAFHGMYLFIWMVNIITYLSLALVFMFYKERTENIA